MTDTQMTYLLTHIQLCWKNKLNMQGFINGIVLGLDRDENTAGYLLSLYARNKRDKFIAEVVRMFSK